MEEEHSLGQVPAALGSMHGPAKGGPSHSAPHFGIAKRGSDVEGERTLEWTFALTVGWCVIAVLDRCETCEQKREERRGKGDETRVDERRGGETLP